MKKSLLSLALLACALPGMAQFSQPVVSPPSNNDVDAAKQIKYYPDDIHEITLTWPGYDLEMTSNGSITISDFVNPTATKLTPDQYTINGETLTIKYDFNQIGTYTIRIPAGSLKNNNDNGRTSDLITIYYIIYNLQLDSELLVTNPPFGQPVVSVGPEITISVPGWDITPDPAYYPDYITYRARFGAGDLTSVWEDLPNTTIKNVEIKDNKCVITLNQEYTNPGTYCLALRDGLFNAAKDNYSDVTFGDPDSTQETILFYTIAGYQCSPANGSTLQNFYGLSILGDNLEISSPGSIKVYNLYFGGDPDELKDYNEKDITVATGATVSDTQVDGMSGKLLTFNGFEPYNGAFTIVIPDGCVKSNGASVGPIYYHFNIQGTEMSMPAVTSIPANNSQMSSLSNIKVAVGEVSNPDTSTGYDFYGAILSGSIVNATLTLPNGSTVNVGGTITHALNSGIGEGVSYEGSFINFILDKTYTDLGKYTLNVPANAFRITPNKYNDIPNEAFTLYFEITDGYSYTIIPENGSNLQTLAGVPISISLNSLNSSYDFSTAQKVTLEVLNVADEDDVVLTASLTKGQNNVWSYTVPVDTEAFLYDGQDYAAQFTIYGPNDQELLNLEAEWHGTYVERPELGVFPTAPTTVPENNSTVAELTSISVTWGMSVVVNEYCENSVTFNGAKINGQATGEFLSFTFSGLTNGTYTLVIPEAYVILTDENGIEYYNEVVTLTYNQNVEDPTITPDDPDNPNDPNDPDDPNDPNDPDEPENPDGPVGVGMINADAQGLYRVFNINGQNVKVTNDSADIINLSNGVYIINGHKVIIKK